MSLRYEIDKYSDKRTEENFQKLAEYIKNLEKNKERHIDECVSEDYCAFMWAIIRAKDPKLLKLVIDTYRKAGVLEEALSEKHLLGDAPRSGNTDIFVQMVKVYKEFGLLESELPHFNYEVLDKAAGNESNITILRKSLQLYRAFGLLDDALKSDHYGILGSAMSSSQPEIFHEVVSLYKKSGILDEALKGLKYNYLEYAAQKGNFEIFNEVANLYRKHRILKEDLEDDWLGVVRHAAGSNEKVLLRAFELYKEVGITEKEYIGKDYSVLFWAIGSDNVKNVELVAEKYKKLRRLKHALKDGESTPYELLYRAADESEEMLLKVVKLYKDYDLYIPALTEVGAAMLCGAAREANQRTFDFVVEELEKNGLLEKTLRQNDFHPLFWTAGHNHKPKSLKMMIRLYEKHQKIWRSAQEIREGDFLNLFYQGMCRSFEPEVWDITEEIYRKNGLMKKALESRDSEEAEGELVPSKEMFGVFYGNAQVGADEKFEKTMKLMKEEGLLNAAAANEKGGQLLQYLTKEGDYIKAKLMLNFIRDYVESIGSPFEKELMTDGPLLLREAIMSKKTRMIKYMTSVYEEYGLLTGSLKDINFAYLTKQSPETAEKCKKILADTYKRLPSAEKKQFITNINDEKFGKDVVFAARGINSDEKNRAKAA